MKTILCIISLLAFGYFSETKQLTNIDAIEVTPSITVHIEGAVLQEGDYTFDTILTIKEMLLEVGVLEEADLSQIVLDKKITPELLLYVPFKKMGLISLNHATIEELQTIKGIGPKKAQLIIDARPYTCLEDLMMVKGIGEKSYRKFREYFCL